MSDRAVTGARLAIVVAYALIASALAAGGFTPAEFDLMVVLGAIAFPAVVLADWINAGVRRDGE
jgi:hypothetical protein